MLNNPYSINIVVSVLVVFTTTYIVYEEGVVLNFHGHSFPLPSSECSPVVPIVSSSCEGLVTNWWVELYV